MEDSETKLCPNCKREIPCVNFTIHSVHCARNIRVCPVCKEPVPQHELQEHHDKLHKLQPCKKCGESVCGTDMEDHIRDSCAHTIKSCRFCELELPRRDLPAHESYCGVRTEQCPECLEWVMIKYRQLHIDSNHGFIRLDDDPAPAPKKELPRANVPRLLPTKMTNVLASTNGPRPTTSKLENRPNGYVKNVNEMPRTELRYFPSTSSTSSASNGEGTSNDWKTTSPINGVKPVKRTNDQPQINTNVATTSKVEKNLGISRGAVKKRPAPKPPTRAPPADSHRDLPYYSAMQRQQDEERARQEQTAYNLAVGLPPVLSAAAKLEKLRKMDALQNPESNVDYKNRLQGRVWKSPEPEFSNAVASGTVLGSDENERRKQEFKNLKPMTPQEFMERFNELQLRKDGERERKKSADRFSEIKSSLRELRRGLNEVTAPYNANSNSSNNNGEREAVIAPQDDVRLPCEFCGKLIVAVDLVQHQTGCRPDLAQLRPRSVSPAGAAVAAGAVSEEGRERGGAGPARGAGGVEARPRPSRHDSYEEPVIPCEFCTESLPIYLISEHQERCGREANLLYPD